MYGDGSRRFSEFVGTARPMTWLRIKTDRDGWEQIGVTFDSPDGVSWTPASSPTTARSSRDAPNQFFLLNQFRAHAARYAQHLNETLRFDVIASAGRLEEDHRQTDHDRHARELRRGGMPSGRRNRPRGADRRRHLRRDSACGSATSRTTSTPTTLCAGSATWTSTLRNSSTTRT